MAVKTIQVPPPESTKSKGIFEEVAKESGADTSHIWHAPVLGGCLNPDSCLAPPNLTSAILAALYHPYVLRFYGVSIAAKNSNGSSELWLVTEKCAGGMDDLVLSHVGMGIRVFLSHSH